MNLFIGGPADGRRLEFDPRQHPTFNIVVEPPLRTRPSFGLDESARYTTYPYRREELWEMDVSYYVYVFGAKNVVKDLINGYRKEMPSSLTPLELSTLMQVSGYSMPENMLFHIVRTWENMYRIGAKNVPTDN